jgi:hypothetical protein
MNQPIYSIGIFNDDSIFDKILSHVTEHVVDLSIDACLILLAKGISRAAHEFLLRRIASITLFGEHEAATASSDLGNDNFDKLASAVAAQDRWLITDAGDPSGHSASGVTASQSAAHAVRSDADFLAAGRRFFSNIAKHIKPTVCSEKSPIGKTTEDTIKWIGGEMRKELFKGEISEGLALTISGLAAAIAKVGLEKFCQQTDEVRIE